MLVELRETSTLTGRTGNNVPFVDEPRLREYGDVFDDHGARQVSGVGVFGSRSRSIWSENGMMTSLTATASGAQ